MTWDLPMGEVPKLQLSDYREVELNHHWLSFAYEQNLFKLFLPKRYGGCELSLSEGLKAIMKTSELYASLGWCANLGSGASYFYKFMPHEVAQKVFSDKKAVIAGSGQSTGRAVLSGEGYMLSGEWDRCSGAAYATTFTVNAVFPDGKVHTILLDRSNVKIVGNWNVFGMKASSTWRIEAADVFIMPDRLFDIGLLKQQDDYAITSIPFDLFARFCMMASLIGSAGCLVNQLKGEIDKNKSSAIDAANRLDDSLRKTKDSFLQLADRFWSIAQNEGVFNEQHDAHLTAAVSVFSRSVFDQSVDCFFKAGLTMSNENSLAHQAWRDVLIIAQHHSLK